MKRRLFTVLFLLAALCLAVCHGEETSVVETRYFSLGVDDIHASEGYIVLQREEADSWVQITVEKDGRKAVYPLDDDPAPVLPLQMGSGSYTITMYESGEPESGTEDPYVPVLQMEITVNVEDRLACFLHPNIYVRYDSDSPWVLKAEKIAGWTDDPAEKYEAITDYILKNFQYDFIKSVTVPDASKQLPDIGYCWDHGTGVDQDLCSLACAMLRSQGIPAMLAVGQHGDYPTAGVWVIADVDHRIMVFDPVAELQADNLDRRTDLLMMSVSMGNLMAY